MKQERSAVFVALVVLALIAGGNGVGEAIVVDGYDITASVSGTPLKEAYREYFKIGVGLNGSSIQTDTVNSRAMTEIIKYHFNSVTYSNLMKPAYLLDQAGSIRNFNAGNPEPAVRFDSVIKGLEFCKSNGIQMRGHVLVWHNQTPDWFFREGYTNSGEGKKGGQFYTPASVVKLLVEILAPDKGKVYDPCCGSGGMFVQSERFLESHGGKFGDISIYGQEANPTTWRLVAMNLAIRGLDFNLGKEPADTFHRDQHPDLRADYILANPPFNVSDWGGERLVDDPRWVYGTPPASNANFAWLQHILWHLAPNGQAGVVLANGSMSSQQNNEGEIRKAMVEADVVEVMVALPPQLFFNTQIPACLWFLTKNKAANGRDRRGEVLFIDARKLGRMETRVHRVFDDEDIQRIAQTVHLWRQDRHAPEGKVYEDVPGFCRSVTLEEIAKHDYVLTPGRYVGAEEVEDDDEAFAEKMERLTAQLAEQMAKGAELDALIRERLGALGYEV